MATYVDKQDYFDFSGIDLDIEMKSSNTDNPSKAIEIFLNRTENWCLDYLKMFFDLQDADIDATYMKKGILHQIDYLRRNGDLSNDGGNKIPTMSPNALNQFKMGGMANIKQGRSVVNDVWSGY